jgi:hypothetical protein
MHYLYQNVCDQKEDIITHGFTEYPERISFINCPRLDHSHVDVQFAIDELKIPIDSKFVGVIRNPLEKQLSLYMFRILKNIYGVKPSPEHFRSMLDNGELIDNRPWQTQHQHTFLEYNGNGIGEWWLYDKIDDHLSEFMKEHDITERVSLQKLNASPGTKKDLINVFYDADTKMQAAKAFAKDIEIYEKVKKRWKLY